MASFQEAHPEIIRIEGGYKLVNIPGDRGGQTYAGISRRSNPHWAGWALIDSQGEKIPHLPAIADDFYRRQYWDAIRGDQIEDQRVATAIYSCAVLSGQRTAGRMAQLCCGAQQDGIIGPATLEALNAVPADLILAKFTLARIGRYVAICNRDRSQSKFLLGWLNRALGEA